MGATRSSPTLAMLRTFVFFTVAYWAAMASPQFERPLPPPVEAMNNLCGSSDITPEECVCADGQLFPSGNDNLVNCNPIRCRCPGQTEEITLQMYGCVNGGDIKCPGQEEVEEYENAAAWDLYSCTDATPIDFNAVRTSKLTGSCACKAGGKLVCKSSNQPIKCPDGSEPSTEVGFLPSFLKNCM